MRVLLFDEKLSFSSSSSSSSSSLKRKSHVERYEGKRLLSVRKWIDAFKLVVDIVRTLIRYRASLRVEYRSGNANAESTREFNLYPSCPLFSPLLSSLPRSASLCSALLFSRFSHVPTVSTASRNGASASRSYSNRIG
uniref:Uncharacterized protein n=1 Tax=Vespula pensylvanica TaxID=30213 RepID=A0A834P523_VESPE|nr:hypothetical protein H0235_005469 [Vespula pensylvanica]